jgi:hypothetical protein
MLQHILAATNFRSVLLRTVIPTVGAAFALQTAVGVPSALAGTERFFDLSGSLTYIACTGLSLALPALRAKAAAGNAIGWSSLIQTLVRSEGVGGAAWNWRQFALSACVGIWATRCKSTV